MKKRILPVVTLSLLLGLAARLWAQSPGLPPDAAKLRSPAPDFTLTDLNGRKINLAMYRGQVVLLNFWATWCAPCRAEIPEFMTLQNRYGNQGLQIVGISLDDDPQAVLAFYKQFKMNYPVAVGDASLAERFGGILGLPVTFLIGCDGRIQGKQSGQADILRIEREFKSALKSEPCVGRKSVSAPQP